MELGSEYNLSLDELCVVDDNIFSYLSDYNAFYFDSGRSALRHIAEHIEYGTKVLLPEFICDSVINCFDNTRVTYYRLNPDFSVNVEDLESKMGEGRVVIFLMHYFGALQPQNVLNQIQSMSEKKDSVIIEDTTHSIFTRKQTIGDYMICSIRKWLPISGGGTLYFKNNKVGVTPPNYTRSTDNLRNYGMILKDLFLNNKLDCNSQYRAIFSESEERLDRQKQIFMVSDLSRFIASCISIRDLKKRRHNNYLLLADELQKIGIKPAIETDLSDIPLVYPLRVRNRDKFRAYLMDQHIYCAVHWPFDNHQSEQRAFAKRNAQELISLPIDQRYDERHIWYLIEKLNHYGGDLLF